MPLHDWTDDSGWDTVHHFWISRLCYWLKPKLPPEYRVYAGSVPGLALRTVNGQPDVNVRQWLPELPSDPPPEGSDEEGQQIKPEIEAATLTLDINTAVLVARQGRLIAVIELVSPRNKDRPDSRAIYLARYLHYLHSGAHLLLVDVHRRPLRFSFGDAMANALQIPQTPLPAPLAASYRVGEPAPAGGRLVAIWRQPLTVGAPLPTMPLNLSVHRWIDVDLELTYMQAAEDAYLT
jgi:hypothetical protein